MFDLVGILLIVKLMWAILQGFGDVFGLYCVGMVEIGNRSSYFDCAHIGTGAEAKFVSGSVEHRFSGI